jgi:hypothetical protein
LRYERECFGSIMNFVSKTNIFNFLGTLEGKRKQTILKKCWFDITSKGKEQIGEGSKGKGI